MNDNGLDQKKAEVFAERMVGVLNDGALALMASIGHRTGLFDTMAILPPATTAQIADAAGLQERYVREWLAAMVTGAVVEYDPEYETYRLPTEHATFLTRQAGAENMALYAQYIGGLGGVEDHVVAAFHKGGGVPYSAFPRFHEMMAEDSGANVVAALQEQILPLVPGLTEALQRGIDVLDVGCGRGLAMITLAAAFPNSRFVGYDFSEEAIGAAQAEVARRELPNVRFAVQDAATFEDTDAYDLICTFDAVHDQAQPATVLRNIYRALRPDGVYLMQDIAGSSHLHNNLDHPMAPLLYTVSTMHCMTVSLAYGGEGLGTMWGREKALEMLAEAGFTDVDVHQLPHDIMNNYFVIRKAW